MLSIGITTGISAALLWAIYDIIAKDFSVKYGNVRAALFATSGAALVMLLGSIVFPSFTINAYDVFLITIAGISSGIAYSLFYISLKDSQVTNTVALVQIQPAVLALFGIFILNESMSNTAILGIVLVFAGSLFVVIDRSFRIDQKLIPAAFAMLLWGLGWIPIAYVIFAMNNFIVPQFLAMLFTIATVIAFTHFSNPKLLKETFAKQKFSMAKAASLGLFNGVAIVLFGAAAFANEIAKAGTLMAFTPVAVAILGAILFRDKLTKGQTLGLLIAVVGAIILAY